MDFTSSYGIVRVLCRQGLANRMRSWACLVRYVSWHTVLSRDLRFHGICVFGMLSHLRFDYLGKLTVEVAKMWREGGCV